MEKMGREELVTMYRPDVERIVAYLPWLTDKSSEDVMQNYTGENGEVSLPFPVYGDIYLAFLETIGSTIFMNPNYHYIYSKYRIRDWNDELVMIQRADIMTMDILGGILSHYVLGGMTKAYLWTNAMDYQIFYHAVKRAKDIIEYWDVPIVVEAIGMEEEAEEEAEEEMPPVEWAEETVEEVVEEAIEEEAEETIEEVVEEAVEEEAEETIEEVVEEAVEEEAEETVEEVVEEAIQEETLQE